MEQDRVGHNVQSSKSQEDQRKTSVEIVGSFNKLDQNNLGEAKALGGKYFCKTKKDSHCESPILESMKRNILSEV